MIRYTHEQLVRRNTGLGRFLAFGGLGILVVALIASLLRPASIGLILPFSLVGMAMSQAGSIFMSRWNRQGRADLVLDEALKGLDGRYTMCHFLLGTHHVLIGPPGVLALVPRTEIGLVEAKDDRWWLTRFRRGRPNGKRRELVGLAEDAESAVRRLDRRLARVAPGHGDWSITPVLVFIGEGTRLEAGETNPPAVHAKKLKEYIRRLPHRPGPDDEDVAKLASTFPAPPSTSKPA